MKKLKKTQARLKSRQKDYDTMIAKKPELAKSFHRPGSFSK